MGRYKARRLYCSEMSSHKLWDHNLTLTHHIVIQRDTKWALGIRAQRGSWPCLPAWARVPSLGRNPTLVLL